ncbi:hypothetical protein J2X47_000382 [Sphingomonas sp. BE270]|nr:hypothetical protein [Sphingomonas sp. BE270]
MFDRSPGTTKEPGKEDNPDDNGQYGPISDHGRLRDPGKERE